MNKEFQDFLNSEDVKPPIIVGDKILALITKELNPSPWKVFSKISFIHFFSALLTLSVCPQFGFRVFGSGAGLMGTFMHLGTYGCMTACGALFLGTSLLIAVSFLKIEEIKVLRKHRLIQIVSLVTLSLGTLIMLSTQIIFSLALAWVIGTLLGALSVLEIGWQLRRTVLQTGRGTF